MKQGSEIALEEINAKGGVLGQKAEVVMGDDEFKAPVAIRKYKEMVDGQGIKAIGGTLSGGISVAVNEWACKNKVLYMCFCHTSIPLGKEQCGYGFVSGMIPYQTGVATAKYAFQNLGKSWMIVTQDYRFGTDELAAWMVTSEKMGGKFLGNIYSPLGQVDYSAHIPKIAATNPDILVINVYGQSQDALIKAVGGGGTDQQEDEIRHSQEPSMQHQGRRAPSTMKTSTAAMSITGPCRINSPRLKSSSRPTGRNTECLPLRMPTADTPGRGPCLEAMNVAKTTTDVDKLVKTLEGFKMDYNKGPEQFRACDHIRDDQRRHRQGDRGQGFEDRNFGEVVAEYPASETLESCENNKKDVPYGAVKLPGK